jgi:tryptophanyl-tRNA synthetase
MSHPDFDPTYVFSHHQPTPEKVAHYDAVHEGALRFAEIILKHVPKGSDQTTALRLLRESAMMANAAIALDGKLSK